MSTLAQRTNALQPTAAEIGDVDAILRRYAELEAKKRAGYAPSKPVEKPVETAPVIEPEPEPIVEPEQPVIRDFLIVGTPKPKHTKKVNIKDCMNYVAHVERVSVREMQSARRSLYIVRPRQMAMYLARTITLRSLPDVGRMFGKRDHTTVLHAVRRVQKLVDAGEWLPPSAEEILRTVRPEALIEEAGE